MLKPGVVRIHEASGVTPVFVRGGFADVTPAGLTILAEEAVRLTQPSLFDDVAADYARVGLSLKAHPLSLVRQPLRARCTWRPR